MSRPDLSPRQRQIIEAVISGEPYRILAPQLGTTEQSLKNSLKRIFDLVGVDNRTQLAVWWVSGGRALYEVPSSTPGCAGR